MDAQAFLPRIGNLPLSSSLLQAILPRNQESAESSSLENVRCPKRRRTCFEGENPILMFNSSSNDKKMAEASSKQQQAVESDGEEGIDKISGLPDSILLHILSFLSTKTCVCTMSLVSRRWRHLWEHLQVFDFCGDDNMGDDIKLVKKFAFFVNAVLTLRQSRDILKMHLDCLLIEEGEFSVVDFIDLWLRAAIGPRLEELHLNFVLTDVYCRVVLPYTLLNCSNLVSLSLNGFFDLKKEQYSWEQVHFPSLKNLCLDVDSVDSIDALLTRCPILETLELHASESSSRGLSVPPSLKSFNYNGFGFLSPTYNINIDAPCLEYLNIKIGETFVTTVVGNLQNIVKAYIDVPFLDVNHLLNLVRAISGTKHLTLGYSTTKLLLCSPISDFLVFRCLRHLNLQLPCFNSNLLANVIENFHVLQDLVIVQSYEEALPRQIWEPESMRIPNCLVSHLTSIHLERFLGFDDELAFIEYILRNALVLKTMIIKFHYSMGPREKLIILKEIINIRRGSDLCQIEFD